MLKLKLESVAKVQKMILLRTFQTHLWRPDTLVTHAKAELDSKFIFCELKKKNQNQSTQQWTDEITYNFFYVFQFLLCFMTTAQ